MLKYIVAIFTLLSGSTSSIAQPTLLSIEGYGGEHEDSFGPYVSRTTDGGFIIHIGSSSQTGNLNTTCTLNGGRGIYNKYNADGSILEWQECNASQPDSNYSILFPLINNESIWGGATSINSGRDFLICRKDANSNIIWAKRYGGTRDELLRGMIRSSDSCYIMYGITYSSDGDVGTHYGDQFSSDLWAIKIDTNGNKLWSVVVGGSNDEGARSLAPSLDGGCYLYAGTVSWDHDCTTYHGAGDALVARIGDTGNIIWTKCFGGTGGDGSYGAISSDGNGGALVVTGSNSNDGDVNNHIGDYDFWLFSVDSNSNIDLNNCYGNPAGSESPRAICRSSDGTIWLGGSVGVSGGQVGQTYGFGDAWIVHVSNTGNYLSSRVLGTGGSDEVSLLYPLTGGTVMACGTYTASGTTGNGLPASWFGLNDIFIARFAPWDLGVTELGKNSSLSAYPNPASNTLYVALSGKENANIIITNTLGTEIYSNKNQTARSGIDISQWPRGIYFLQALEGDTKVLVEKIVIQAL